MGSVPYHRGGIHAISDGKPWSITMDLRGSRFGLILFFNYEGVKQSLTTHSRVLCLEECRDGEALSGRLSSLGSAVSGSRTLLGELSSSHFMAV